MAEKFRDILDLNYFVILPDDHLKLKWDCFMAM